MNVVLFVIIHLARTQCRDFGIAPKCQNVMWLHPPKTSSTFCTTIAHVCCPVKFETIVKQLISTNEGYTTDFYQGCALPSNFRGTGLPSCVGPCKKHVPYPVDYQDKMRLFKNQSNIIAITIMRQPGKRLISSFFDGGGHWNGFGTEEQIKLLQQWATYPQEEPEQIKQTTIRKALEYIYHPHMIGCVTKMLLGYQCYSDYLSKQSSFNVTALHVAKQRLRQFFFVGIFEHYEESIRLFHLLANKSTQPHWTELKKQRLTVIDPEIRAILLANVTTSFVDPYDDELYAQAKEWFLKTNKTYHTV